MNLPCAQCGRPLERKDVFAVHGVVVIEYDLTTKRRGSATRCSHG